MAVKCFFDIAVDGKGIGRIVFEVSLHGCILTFRISLAALQRYSAKDCW